MILLPTKLFGLVDRHPQLDNLAVASLQLAPQLVQLILRLSMRVFVASDEADWRSISIILMHLRLLDHLHLLHAQRLVQAVSLRLGV